MELDLCGSQLDSHDMLLKRPFKNAALKVSKTNPRTSNNIDFISPVPCEIQVPSDAERAMNVDQLVRVRLAAAVNDCTQDSLWNC